MSVKDIEKQNELTQEGFEKVNTSTTINGSRRFQCRQCREWYSFNYMKMFDGICQADFGKLVFRG